MVLMRTMKPAARDGTGQSSVCGQGRVSQVTIRLFSSSSYVMRNHRDPVLALMAQGRATMQSALCRSLDMPSL